MKKNIDLTQGSILKSLIVLSVPIILANLLQTAYQLTDTFWVGRLGSVAIAAISISFPIIFFIIALGGGLAIAGTILVAQYKGQKNNLAINHTTSQTILVVFIISLILSALGYYFSPYLVSLMGVENNVFLSAVSYLKISFIGLVFVYIFMVFQSLMRGVGDVKTPMYIVLGTVLLNLILDPLFIFGFGPIPALGVAGAALATVGTQGLAAIIGISLLIKGRNSIKFNINDLKPDFKLIKKMFKIGFPASIEQSSRALAIAAITFLIASFGTFFIAAFGIAGRVLSFIIIPALGLSMATSTLVGQNIGADKIKRAEQVAKLSSLIGFVTLTLVGVVIFIFAKQISTFFIPGQERTIQISTTFIKIIALTFGFMSVQQILAGAFRGAGKTLTTMVLSIISLWVLRFPLAYVLSRYTSLSAYGVMIAFPIVNIIGAVIVVVWFLRGGWKQQKIITDLDLISEANKEREVLSETIIEEGPG